MKRLVVADEDQAFQSAIQSFCGSVSVDLKFYSSSMEALALLADDKPDIIIISLELPDMNDFLMYDLLRKAENDPPTAVMVTYSANFEEQLPNYQKLKFQPQSYHKKPLDQGQLEEMLGALLGKKRGKGKKTPVPEAPAEREKTVDEEDDAIFTEVMSEEDDVEVKLEPPEPEEDKGFKTDEVFSQAVFSVSDGEKVHMGIEDETHKELAARVMSLGKQNDILRTENKRLQGENEKLKDKLEKITSAAEEEKNILELTAKNLEKKLEESEAELKEEQDSIDGKTGTFERTVKLLQAEKKKLESDNEELTRKIEELTDKLTDKQREVIAKDYEFEKKLQKELDKTLQEAEQRFMSESREKIERLSMDVGRLENEKARMQSSHDEELEQQKKVILQLKQEIEGHIKNAAELTGGISDLKKEKESLQAQFQDTESKINAREEEMNLIKQRLSSSEEELGAVKREKDLLTRTLANKEDDLTRAVAERDEISGKLAEVESQATSLLKEKEDLSLRISASESEVASLRDEVGNKEKSYNDTIEDLNTRLEGAGEELRVRQEQLSTLEEILQKALSVTRENDTQ